MKSPPLAAILICAALGACTATHQPAPASLVSLPPPPPPGEPAGLAGMQAAELRIAFGAPALVRKDGLTQMWRYDGAACKAFFFLYSDNGVAAVRHVETVPRGREIAADPTCLAAIRAHPAATPVS